MQASLFSFLQRSVSPSVQPCCAAIWRSSHEHAGIHTLSAASHERPRTLPPPPVVQAREGKRPCFYRKEAKFSACIKERKVFSLTFVFFLSSNRVEHSSSSSCVTPTFSQRGLIFQNFRYTIYFRHDKRLRLECLCCYFKLSCRAMLKQDVSPGHRVEMNMSNTSKCKNN